VHAGGLLIFCAEKPAVWLTPKSENAYSNVSETRVPSAMLARITLVWIDTDVTFFMDEAQLRQDIAQLEQRLKEIGQPRSPSQANTYQAVLNKLMLLQDRLGALQERRLKEEYEKPS